MHFYFFPYLLVDKWPLIYLAVFAIKKMVCRHQKANYALDTNVG